MHIAYCIFMKHLKMHMSYVDHTLQLSRAFVGICMCCTNDVPKKMQEMLNWWGSYFLLR